MFGFSVPARAGTMVDTAIGVHPYVDLFLLDLRLCRMHYRMSQVTCRKRTGEHSKENNDCESCTPHIPYSKPGLLAPLADMVVQTLSVNANTLF
jgi:hypothetical protein